MSKEGIAFLESWLTEHIIEDIKQAVDGDGASLSVELAERLLLMRRKLDLDDFEPESGLPVALIREATESDEEDPVVADGAVD